MVGQCNGPDTEFDDWFRVPFMRVSDPARGEKILEKAARLFATRPYHEVRMDDVAKEAGVAKGTIYCYFEDKEDLYLGLILSAVDRLFEEVRGGIAHVEHPKEKLLLYLQSALNFFEVHPYFFELVQRIESS